MPPLETPRLPTRMMITVASEHKVINLSEIDHV